MVQAGRAVLLCREVHRGQSVQESQALLFLLSPRAFQRRLAGPVGPLSLAAPLSPECPAPPCLLGVQMVQVGPSLLSVQAFPEGLVGHVLLGSLAGQMALAFQAYPAVLLVLVVPLSLLPLDGQTLLEPLGCPAPLALL